MWLALLCSLASAHPIAMRVADHKTHVEVDAGEVRVMYEVQFPVHTATDRLEVASADELVSGILVRVDNETVPMTVVTSGDRLTDHDSFGWAELRGPLPSANPRHVEVSLANYPDHPGIFRWDPWVHRQYVVSDSNLLVEKASGLKAYSNHPLHGDDWRALTLDMSPLGPLDRAWSALVPRPSPARPLAEALATPWWSALLGGAPGPALLLLGMPLAAAAGLGAYRREPPDDWISGVLFLLWLSVAWMTPSPGVTDGVATVLAWAAVVVVLARPRHYTTIASGAIVAAWASVLGAGAAGFFVWMAWATGRAASREERGTTALVVASAGTVALISLRMGYPLFR